LPKKEIAQNLEKEEEEIGRIELTNTGGFVAFLADG